jgi:hypothetical protein
MKTKSPIILMIMGTRMTLKRISSIILMMTTTLAKQILTMQRMSKIMMEAVRMTLKGMRWLSRRHIPLILTARILI